MFEVAENVELSTLTGLLDELSTRLIIDGAGTLVAGDFERLGRTAAELGNGRVAEAAQRIAEKIAPAAALSAAEAMRLLSCGLDELRSLLEDPQAAPAATPATAAARPEAVNEPGPKLPASNSLAADEDLIREFITESNEPSDANEKFTALLGSPTRPNSALCRRIC